MRIWHTNQDTPPTGVVLPLGASLRVMVCALDGSTLLRSMDELARLMVTTMSATSLHLLTPAGSRVYSVWKQQWLTEGVLS